MPRSNREYLLRYADQAINDLERCLERLKMLSDAYGGVYRPMDGDVLPELKEVPSEYAGNYALYQKNIDAIGAMLMIAYENLKDFKIKFM